MAETGGAPPRPATVGEASHAGGRDRWVDALRVGSLLVVVIGHWLMVVLTPAGEITNALSLVPSLQPVTWILQVMPVFFLVGGVANAYSLDSLERRSGATPGRYAAFLLARATRLLRPSLAFLGVWVAFGVVAHLTGLTSGPDGGFVREALVRVPQLLWFIGIYLGVCACAPPMLRLHRRWGLWVVVALGALAGLVDLVRFTGGPAVVGNVNFGLVWLALQQLGFAWHDGQLTPRGGLALTLLGWGGMLLAVSAGPYPTSMVGLPGESVSNMAPPTVALLAQGLGMAGLAVLLRPAMARALAGARAWRLVLAAAPFAMTAFLWHLTALMLVLLGLRALGVEQPGVASPAWWATRPGLFLVLALVTAALVAVFVRFDVGPRAPAVPQARSAFWTDAAAAGSAVLIVLGILMVSVVGVDVLGNRGTLFVVTEVTPGVALGITALGITGLRVAVLGKTAGASGPRRRPEAGRKPL